MDCNRIHDGSPRVPRSMHIMDAVNRRIHGESVGSGDTFVEVLDSSNRSKRLESDNAARNVDGSSESVASVRTCSSTDSYCSQERAFFQCGVSNFSVKGSSTGSLHRRRCRFIRKSGHCNVSHAHLQDKPQRFLADIFTTCVDLRWRWNLLLFSTTFIVSWLLFGIVYWVISYAHGDFDAPQDRRSGGQCVNNLDRSASFTSAFLFSLETQTTIGYGFRVVTEECPAAVITVVVQSVFGCVIDAFMIGLIMAKISRPKKRAETLLFSKKAVINVRDGRLCLMVRVGNLRKSHLVEATIRMQYLFSRITLEGEFIPLDQVDLHLDLKNDSDRLFLVTPQTICHPIDAESPLYHMSKEKLMSANFEIIVILEGMVEATGMTTQARASYLPDEILWGHRFENAISFSQTDGYHVNFKKFDNLYVTSDTPSCSAAELSRSKPTTANGPRNTAKRRSIGGSVKIIREDSGGCDGLDAGCAPAEEKDDSPAPKTNAKTRHRSHDGSQLSYNASGEIASTKSNKQGRSESEDESNRVASLTATTEKEQSYGRRKSSEIAALLTQEQNLKNETLNVTPAQAKNSVTDPSKPIRNPAHLPGDRRPKQYDSVTSSIPVTSRSFPKFEGEVVFKCSDGAVCLADGTPGSEETSKTEELTEDSNDTLQGDSPV